MSAPTRSVELAGRDVQAERERDWTGKRDVVSEGHPFDAPSATSHTSCAVASMTMRYAITVV